MSPVSIMHGINRKMLLQRNRILVQTDVENAVPDKLQKECMHFYHTLRYTVYININNTGLTILAYLYC